MLLYDHAVINAVRVQLNRVGHCINRNSISLQMHTWKAINVVRVQLTGVVQGD